jgi:hypothetical protein
VAVDNCDAERTPVVEVVMEHEPAQIKKDGD